MITKEHKQQIESYVENEEMINEIAKIQTKLTILDFKQEDEERKLKLISTVGNSLGGVMNGSGSGLDSMIESGLISGLVWKYGNEIRFSSKKEKGELILNLKKKIESITATPKNKKLISNLKKDIEFIENANEILELEKDFNLLSVINSFTNKELFEFWSKVPLSDDTKKLDKSMTFRSGTTSTTLIDILKNCGVISDLKNDVKLMLLFKKKILIDSTKKKESISADEKKHFFHSKFEKYGGLDYTYENGSLDYPTPRETETGKGIGTEKGTITGKGTGIGTGIGESKEPLFSNNDANIYCNKYQLINQESALIKNITGSLIKTVEKTIMNGDLLSDFSKKKFISDVEREFIKIISERFYDRYELSYSPYRKDTYDDDACDIDKYEKKKLILELKEEIIKAEDLQFKFGRILNENKESPQSIITELEKINSKIDETIELILKHEKDYFTTVLGKYFNVNLADGFYRCGAKNPMMLSKFVEIYKEFMKKVNFLYLACPNFQFNFLITKNTGKQPFSLKKLSKIANEKYVSLDKQKDVYTLYELSNIFEDELKKFGIQFEKKFGSQFDRINFNLEELSNIADYLNDDRKKKFTDEELKLLSSKYVDLVINNEFFNSKSMRGKRNINSMCSFRGEPSLCGWCDKENKGEIDIKYDYNSKKRKWEKVN
jgi:hypothetical protein